MTLGHDPCGGALRWTEAALSPGVPGAQAVVLDMLNLLKEVYNWTERRSLVAVSLCVQTEK